MCVCRSFFLFDELTRVCTRILLARGAFLVVVSADDCRISPDLCWYATIAVTVTTAVIGVGARIVVLPPEVETGDHVFASFVFVCIQDLFKYC